SSDMKELLSVCNNILDAIKEGNKQYTPVDLSNLEQLLKDIIKNQGEDSKTLTSIENLLKTVVSNTNNLKDMLSELKNIDSALTDENTSALLKFLKNIQSTMNDNNKLFSDIKDLLSDIKQLQQASLISDILDGLTGDTDEDKANSLIDNLATSVSPIVQTAKSRFPFSCPWDLIAVVTFLRADPETPVFTIPFKVKSIGYSNNVKIDMEQFETISTVSRSFLALLFLLLLIWITVKFYNMFTGGEDK
ncbi:MAG: hypothetical protein Q4B70_05820, partial [Lachnospiraceae bacterium]|nr:hypothetical protein [Lachnospiraceae bacterium]